MLMKPYEKYKDSGVEWIGKVPEHWEVKRLKWIGFFRSGEGITSEMIFPEGDFPVFGGNGIRGFYNKFTHDGTFILIGRQGALCGNIQYGKGKFWASEHAIVVHPLVEYAVIFLGELLRSMNLNQYSVAAAQPGLSVEMIKNLKIPFPPLPEQTAIARYLDQKTSEIDQLIAQKERLLALWEEEKTALINQAVTRGLDAGAKMKDSGVAWLGEVPEHWEVKRLKYVGEINPTKDFDFEYDTETLCTFLPMEKVSEEGEIDCSIKKPVSELVSGFTFFKKNDVIVAKITPCFENGKGAILEKLDTDFGFGSTEFHVIRPKNDVLGKFLYFLTKSEIFMNMGEAMMIGSAGQKRVPTDFIRNFTVSLPKLLEQTAIVRHIETQTARIQTQMNQTRKLIELLREYRATLISEVVTGKVKITE